MGDPVKVDGIEVLGPVDEAFSQILTPEALQFVGALALEFESQRKTLLQNRQKRQTEIDGGKLPDFLEETRSIRESDWQVAPIPDDLKDRRVEITGPVDRKMIINALNSGASTYMADFEDSHSPTWKGT
ncbi:MAG: malate synthase A, partial [Desulfobacterales bacterium]